MSVEPLVCRDCGVDVGLNGEYWYMVWDGVWAATSLGPNDGRLCVACIEERLGRQLHAGDFNDAPINDMAAWQSERLRSRITKVPAL